MASKRPTISFSKPGRSVRSGALPLFFVLGLLAAFLSGCVSLRDPETSQEQTSHVAGTVSPGQPLSQTFTAQRSGLNQITLWGGVQVEPEQAGARLLFELFAGQETLPRVSQETDVLSDGAQVFSFSSQPDPPGQLYRVQLTALSGAVNLFGRAEDSYPSGQAFAGETPLAADLAFRTTYLYGAQSALEDWGNLLGRSWLLLLLVLLLLGPGWLLLDIFGLRTFFDPAEQAALSLGTSLALLPLFMLWSSISGLRWSWGAVAAGAVLILAAVLWQVLRRPFRFSISWNALALFGIFLLTLWLRLAMVRDLAAPAWVDSVHHALITRLIMLNGAFPETYAPYLPLDATQYHAGFHSGLAAFTWLARLDLPEALLFYGQTLNAAAVLAVYLLTSTLTRSPKAALAAALLTGLVTPMPAYYASWGRYTQLAGLLILPVAPALLRLFWEWKAHDRQTDSLPEASSERAADVRKRAYLWALLTAALSLGGLLIVHYRVAAFAALLLAAFVLSQAPLTRAGWSSYTRKTLLAGSLLLVLPLLLSAPWIFPTLVRHIFPALTPEQVIEASPFGDFAWRYLTAGLGAWSLYLALAGLAWAAWKRQRFALTLLLWTALLFLLANLGALGLPGAAFVNNTSVQITLFMPISLLGGYAWAGLWEAWHSRLPHVLHRPYRTLLVLGLAVLLTQGARQLLTILNPVTELYRAADRPAIEWINAHVPAHETILLNSFSWGYGVYAGADGGYWISPLTGRQTMPPPVLYGLGQRAELRRISELSRQVITYAGNPEEISRLMRENSMNYIFLGARGGVVSAQALIESPLFRLVYESGSARIFLLEE